MCQQRHHEAQVILHYCPQQLLPQRDVRLGQWSQEELLLILGPDPALLLLPARWDTVTVTTGCCVHRGTCTGTATPNTPCVSSVHVSHAGILARSLLCPIIPTSVPGALCMSRSSRHRPDTRRSHCTFLGLLVHVGPCTHSGHIPHSDPTTVIPQRDTRTSLLAPRTLSCLSVTCQPGDSVLCLCAGPGQRQGKVSCRAQQPSATGGALSLLPSRLVQTKAAAASVPPGAAGPGGSMCAVPPLSAAILSICIWRAAINAPRGACSLPPPPDPLLSVDKPQNGLLLG